MMKANNHKMQQQIFIVTIIGCTLGICHQYFKRLKSINKELSSTADRCITSESQWENVTKKIDFRNKTENRNHASVTDKTN